MTDAAVRQQTRWWDRRWFVVTACLFLAVALTGALTVEWALRRAQPVLRQRVIETLSARFHSPVELDRFSLSMNKDVIVTGGGLRILYLAGPTKPDARPNAPPMLTVESFEFRTHWRALLRPTTRLVLVKVHGLQVNLPPAGERQGILPDEAKRQRQPVLALAVDRIECTDAKVVLETSKPGKLPLEFDIKSLLLTDVGQEKPLNFTAVLTNPKPVGDVRATGHFGPWQADSPRDSPIDGSYSFTNANLSSIHGLGGILSSTGQFGGTLGNLTAQGTTETPAFRLDVSDHALPLHTEFQAVVDGTTGDTHLEQVRARLGRSEMTVTGSIVKAANGAGHDVNLNVAMDRARIEDMLALGLKGNPPLMRGGLAMKAHLEVPPGKVNVSQKMRMSGTFAIRDAFLNDAKRQQMIDEMSERALGQPKLANRQDAARASSSLSGRFSLANGVVDIAQMVYGMPGAQVMLAGQMNLAPATFGFTGKVRMEAKASQMTTGWKSLLAKPFDKALAKNGAGVELPIKATGTRNTYELGLAFPHAKMPETLQSQQNEANHSK